MSFAPDRAGHVISRPQPTVLDTLGPTVELLTLSPVDGIDDGAAPGLLRGSMPSGVVVPLHAHDDPETFYVLSGGLQILTMTGSDAEWVGLDVGQVFHVPPRARHALRNVGTETAATLIVTTPRMVSFFERIGTPPDEVVPGPPSAATMARFAAVTAERGDWNGSPADNAAVGIELPPPPAADGGRT